MFCKERKKRTTFGNLNFELHSLNCKCTLPFLHQDTYSKCNHAKCPLARFDNQLHMTKLVLVGYSLADSKLTNWSFPLLTLSVSLSLAHTTWGSDFPATKVPDTDSAVPLNITLTFEQKYKPPGRNRKDLYIKTRINRLCNPGSMNVVVQCLAKLQF